MQGHVGSLLASIEWELPAVSFVTINIPRDVHSCPTQPDGYTVVAAQLGPGSAQVNGCVHH